MSHRYVNETIYLIRSLKDRTRYFPVGGVTQSDLLVVSVEFDNSVETIGIPCLKHIDDIAGADSTFFKVRMPFFATLETVDSIVYIRIHLAHFSICSTFT